MRGWLEDVKPLYVKEGMKPAISTKLPDGFSIIKFELDACAFAN